MLGFIKGLRKSKERLSVPLRALFSSSVIDDATAEEIEALLYSADLGTEATGRILERLRSGALNGGGGVDGYLRAVEEELLASFDAIARPDAPMGRPRVIVITGVNGVGKTSTIGKLAHMFKNEGKTVLLAACDTFRAAAIEQLELWAERAGVPIVRQRMGADSAAVAYDAVQSALSKDMDIVIIDTAGRLHTKRNLMEELKKIFRVLAAKAEGIALESWLVIDANLGQNSLKQAEAFVEALPVTGLILSKLDSTAKGGAVVPIQNKLGIPVLYAGFGEGLEDLEPFDYRLFVSALIGSK